MEETQEFYTIRSSGLVQVRRAQAKEERGSSDQGSVRSLLERGRVRSSELLRVRKGRAKQEGGFSDQGSVKGLLER